LSDDSPGIGIALKVTDGDATRTKANLDSYSRVRPAVMLEVLRQLNALATKQAQALSAFGPGLPLKNLRGIETGHSRPVFEL